MSTAGLHHLCVYLYNDSLDRRRQPLTLRGQGNDGPFNSHSIWSFNALNIAFLNGTILKLSYVNSRGRLGTIIVFYLFIFQLFLYIIHRLLQPNHYIWCKIHNYITKVISPLKQYFNITFFNSQSAVSAER